MQKTKKFVLGGLLAGSLIAPASPALAQSLEFVNDRYTFRDYRNDRREIVRDERRLDRAMEQLAQDRETLDRHLRQGAHSRTIAQDRERIRESEARVREARAELREDRRDLAQNYREWRSDRYDRFNSFD